MKQPINFSAIGLRLLLLLLLFSLPFFINAQAYMRANLYINNQQGSGVLMDGNLTNYGDQYSNAVDMDDAWKMTNSSENFGIVREGKTLIVERRKPVTTTDTSFFKMWNMVHQSYQLEIILKNFTTPGLYAKVLDRYLNLETSVPLNDTTWVGFAVNADPASYDPLRFQLIYFKLNTASVPISFTSFKAWRVPQGVEVEWNVMNEVSVEQYVVEHSADGRNFESAFNIPANNAGSKSYNYLHGSPLSGDNFYRIKAIRMTGSIETSSIVKVGGVDAEVAVYPNPVTGNTIRMRMETKEAGLYQLSLIGAAGRAYPLKAVTVSAGQSYQTIGLPPNTRPGIYRLRITSPGNQQQTRTVYIQ